MKLPVLFKFCLTIIIILLSWEVLAQVAKERDPTRPAVQIGSIKDTSVERYQLQSIIIGRSRRLALINDQFVSIGDSIGSAVVIAIDRNSVVLSESGRKLKIDLFDSGIRK
ncbi:hypothetical protein [Legionella oakridgensis]|uniref:Pilus MSHA type biogenesis protein n=3 Tax=Legionella oakridgensis TaxID=29423 RepID=W0BI62_9GAMM|nr:hypothetical protein [Legionella oakridgensis]AHE68381.1 pilus MSHA type biogenesis protein [Legionella oakridgensis ATCC 33761 = DSM 21215]KTD38951.1 hypothetical protein Loak_1072 [Legionella oakridgensis]STY21321.1 Uncharacterised protein [Legionella longbeachae]